MAKDRAEREKMEKIRKQYTPAELNAVMEEVKIAYNDNGNQLDNDMHSKLNAYGITAQQFYFYRTNGKKICAFDDMRTGKLEKIKTEDVKIDFEIDPNEKKSIDNIIKAYYANGKKCPDIIFKELTKKGISWNDFMLKNLDKFKTTIQL